MKKNMFVATVDYLPDKKYIVLGIVSGNRIASFLSKTEFNKALEKCIEEAKEMGADGLIGVRVFTTPNGSTCVVGTAIRFTDRD